jgi:integrase
LALRGSSRKRAGCPTEGRATTRLRPLAVFASATGLRPEEWRAVERRDVDRSDRLLNVSRTVSSGEIVELGKTAHGRRQVPLSQRALDVLDALLARLDTPLLFPAPGGGLLHVDNFRRREWAPAIEASGVRTPARIYDLRSTFASRALAAGVSVFQLARIMGTSVRMIEHHYGALLDGLRSRDRDPARRTRRRAGAAMRRVPREAEAFGPQPVHDRSRCRAGLGSAMGSG